jgi:sterol desaturase/sphingolipid hydroxylase (fatty acid hydroxylase superfamily)
VVVAHTTYKPWQSTYRKFNTNSHFAIFGPCYILGDTWFCCAHYFIHKYSQLNQYIHAEHHKYRIPVAIIGMYSSLSEMIIINLPLAIVFPCIFACDSRIQSIWLFVLATHISLNHSCHQILPIWISDASYHPTHHIKCNVNFGADWIQKNIIKLDPKIFVCKSSLHTIKPNPQYIYI